MLTIRKAFTFEDVASDLEHPVSVASTDLVPAVRKEGYGFYCSEYWIVAHPDAAAHQIVVTKFLNGKKSRVRVDTFPTTYQTNPNAEGVIRKEIIEFLVLIKLVSMPLDW